MSFYLQSQPWIVLHNELMLHSFDDYNPFKVLVGVYPDLKSYLIYRTSGGMYAVSRDGVLDVIFDTIEEVVGFFKERLSEL